MALANASTRPASYGQMFDTIVSTVAHDWAAAGENPERSLPQVRAQVARLGSRGSHADDAAFLELARCYLRALGDPNLVLVKMGDDPRREPDLPAGAVAPAGFDPTPRASGHGVRAFGGCGGYVPPDPAQLRRRRRFGRPARRACPRSGSLRVFGP